MLKRLRLQLFDVLVAVSSIFAPAPKRWQGMLRVVAVTYGTGEVRYEVERRCFAEFCVFWSKVKDFETVNDAEAHAWGIYESCVMRREVIRQ